MSAIDREFPATVKPTVAESPTGSPVSVTVYPPGDTLPTVKAAVITPPVIEQVLEVTDPPVRAQVASLAEKPEASTSIGVPTGA